MKKWLLTTLFLGVLHAETAYAPTPYDWSVKINPLVLLSPTIPAFGDLQIEVEKAINYNTSIAIQAGETASKSWDTNSLDGLYAEVKVYGFLNGAMNTSLYLSPLIGLGVGTLASDTSTTQTKFYYGLNGGKLYMFGPFSLNLDIGLLQYFMGTTNSLSLSGNLLLGFAF